MNTSYFKYLFFSVTLLMFACKAKQVGTQVETIIFDDNWTAPEVVSEIEEIDTFVLNKHAADTALIDSSVFELINKKTAYKVALVLPFMEDSLRSAWSHAKEKNFREFKTSQESEISASFLEGMLMALKQLKIDAKFDFVVYDDNNDGSRIDGIIEKIKADSVDIIIGSYNKQNVMKLASFAKANNLIHFSPFSPSKSASGNYAKYYMFEPSLEQHFLTMIHYGLDSIEDPHFKFIYHDNAIGQFYANFISDYINALNDSLDTEEKIHYAIYQTPTSSFKIDNVLDPGANNVFIVNSFDETFVHTFLKQINSSNKYNKIVSFGMPGWENSKIIRLEYVSSSNIHFTKSSWIDWENPEVEAFGALYKMKYGAMPKEATFLAYDLASAMFNMIDKYGLNFNETILNTTYEGLDRNFSFQKIKNADGKVSRIENTNLRIYKIEDFEAILVK